MTRRKRVSVFVLLTAAALMIVGGVAWAAGAFTDVPENDAHFDSIEWAAANGVVNGFGDGTFKPYQPVARAQVATMFKNYDEYLQSLSVGQGACADCHNETPLVTAKQAAWKHSLHGAGEVWLEDGAEAGCAGCHSGSAFSSVVAAGLGVNQVPADDPALDNPTPQDCRACHQVHETFTGDDWALETTEAVAMYALSGNTFDGGDGNLCANCHQARRAFPAADANGNVSVNSRFGPHHGPQSSMLLGIGGALVDAGQPMFHYTGIGDTCVTCHVADPASHTFEPKVSACTGCHATEDFNVGNTQTEVQDMLAQLQAALTGAGLLNAEGAIVPGSYPEAQAGALWNWVYVSKEDKSGGVHNPNYAKALLEAGLQVFAG